MADLSDCEDGEISPIISISHNPNIKISQHKVKKVSAERINYLWSRVRNVSKIIGRLNIMTKEIKVYGVSKKQSPDKDSITASTKQIPRFLFTLDHSFLKYWSFVLLACMMWTATIMPYRLCFFEEKVDAWFVIDLVVDAVFMLDILITLNSAYEERANLIVYDRKKIAIRYIKSWLMFDLFACIPFQLFMNEDESQYNRLVRLARIPRIYRLVRIIRLLRVFRLVKSQGFFNKVSNLLKMNAGILRLLKFSVSVILIVHIVGCFWYYIAKIDDFSPDTWVTRHQILDDSIEEKYLASIYWVITTLTTVGFGDIQPKTPYERVFAIVLMGFGVGFYSYTISNLSTIISAMDIRTYNLKARLNALNDFETATTLPDELKKKIRKFIIHNHQYNVFTWFDPEVFIKELPSTLRTEVSIHMHKEVVKNIHFFRGKDPSFISFVVPRLKNLHLNFREIVYREDDHAEEGKR